ncbi:MAG TPA: DNA polymerase III subunit gamma/tau [Acidimicrobiia bacterium]|nr:DNA polymerase III subunit gamma/tau [Acidimicrobiia bacterium]
MEYQALYRKYRPQSFDDVIGQSHVTTTLAREIADGRVAHAYLFTGPRGTGKTTTARILAKALNCTNRGPLGAPCNECLSCVSITEGTSLDVLELDAASHNSIDDIREIRVSVTTVASTATSKRVFVLDEAHMLSKAAGNALLKTLEEPPEHVHFVLATTEPYKLLDTIRSRSQRFDFHPVPVEDLAGHLTLIAGREGYQFDAAALLAIARHAGGSVRDSLSLLEQVAALGAGSVELAGVRRALGLADSEAFMRLVESVAAQDAKSALDLVAELSADGVDLRRFVAESVAFFRGAFLAHYAPNLAEIADEPPEVYGAWRKAAELVPSGDVLRAVDLLGEALIRLREGREERLMTELALIKLTRPETASDPAALLSRIERLERRPIRPDAPDHPPVVTDGPIPTPAPGDADPGGAEQSASPTAPTTGNGSEVSFEKLQKVWPGLFGSLRDVLGARRWAFFREAVPVSVDGDIITLEVAHDFHLQSLQEDDVVASIVATRASDLLGGEVKVRFQSRQSSHTEGDEIDITELEERPERATDPTSLLVDELGAEEVEDP